MLKYLPTPEPLHGGRRHLQRHGDQPDQLPRRLLQPRHHDPNVELRRQLLLDGRRSPPAAQRHGAHRLEHQRQKLNSFVRYSQDYDHDYTNFQLPVKDGSGNYNPFSVDFNKPGHGYAVGLTYTMTPTMVNEFTFGKIWNGIGWYIHE